MTLANVPCAAFRAALVAGCLIVLFTHPLAGQAAQGDPPTVPDLLKKYTDQHGRRPDSALATLRAVLTSASREDSDDVSRYALIEGNRLFRLANVTQAFDSLTSRNLDTHVDSLGVVIEYLSLADSVRTTSDSRFFLSVAYYYRARTEAVQALRTDNCNKWLAVHNDATLSKKHSDRRSSSGSNGVPPKDPLSLLLEYADNILRTRCEVGPKAAA